jgi:Skp family chaperone for outer membrane proteins
MIKNKIAALLFITCLASPAYGGDSIACVDIQYVLSNSNVGRKAKDMMANLIVNKSKDEKEQIDKKLTSFVLDKIQMVVSNYGKKHGFTIIFVKNESSLMCNEVTNDITSLANLDSSIVASLLGFDPDKIASDTKNATLGKGQSTPSPSAPPALSTIVSFYEPSGNQILDADETGNITITIQNGGKGDAFDVVAEITPSKEINGISFDRRVTIGTLPAGSKITKVINLISSEDLPSDTITYSIDIKEANGFDPQSAKITFQTKALEPPKIIVADFGISDQSGGSKVEPGKIVEATVRIQNIGHGDARNVNAKIIFGKNVFISGESVTSYNLETLPSGQFKDIKFSFYTNNRISNGENIPIKVQIFEAREKFGTSRQLELVMNSPQKSAQEFVVKAINSPANKDIQVATGLTVDVDQNIPEGQKTGQYDVAVVIGNRNYSASGAPDVDYANRDAQTMRDYLTRTMGYNADNIIYVEDATFTRFNEIFGTERSHKGKLFNYVKEGKSKIFVYYVGHGAPDAESSEAYFVPVDASPQMLKISGYRLQTLYDNLAKLNAQKVTVVIDACFSGATQKGTLFKGTSALVRKEKSTKQPNNALVITSSSGEQFSSWYPEKRHSLFTYYFLKGLQGNADYNKDGKITAGELKMFLVENIPYMARRLTGNEQIPQVTGNDADVLVVFKK